MNIIQVNLKDSIVHFDTINKHILLNYTGKSKSLNNKHKECHIICNGIVYDVNYIFQDISTRTVYYSRLDRIESIKYTDYLIYEDKNVYVV